MLAEAMATRLTANVCRASAFLFCLSVFSTQVDASAYVCKSIKMNKYVRGRAYAAWCEGEEQTNEVMVGCRAGARHWEKQQKAAVVAATACISAFTLVMC
jgi:hypothetical protein